MLKGRGSRDGDETPILLLGLSRENTAHLHEGRPIIISAADMVGMGFPAIEVTIMAGETEASLSQSLGGLPLQPEVPGQVFYQKARK